MKTRINKKAITRWSHKLADALIDSGFGMDEQDMVKWLIKNSVGIGPHGIAIVIAATRKALKSC